MVAPTRENQAWETNVNQHQQTAEQAADRAEAILEHVIAAKGGSRRAGQVQMARDVATALTDEQPLMIQGGTGIGKALDVTTPIPTPAGFVPMGDLQAGDHVFDEHGNPVAISHAFDVLHDRPCFEVRFSDGATLVADAEHLWTTVPTPTIGAPPPDPWHKARTITTAELARTVTDDRGRNGHSIPITTAVDGVETDLPLDPYVLGVWLGGSTETSLCARVLDTHAPQDLPGFTREVRRRYAVFTPTEETTLTLKALGVTDGTKHIPHPYLFASMAQREALLAGLLDASGVVVSPPRTTGQVHFGDAVQNLAADTQVLACSLGHRATFKPRRASRDSDIVRTWLVLFSPDREVFRSPLKNERLRLEARDTATLRRADYRTIVEVSTVPTRPVRCIAVDSPTHLYLAGHNFVPTHNSIAVIAGSLAAGKSTVLAPHTKALQDQLANDLRLIEEAFAADHELIGHAPTHAVIKGRSAYACLGKINDDTEALLDEPQSGASSALGQQVTALREWAHESDTGDRSTVPFPITSRAWEQISVTAESCTSKACAFYDDCFAEKARAKARAADIIVTNQAFLAMAMRIDGQAGRPILLPETVGAIVVDEAHEFAAVVAETFGAQVTMDRLRAAVKRTNVLDSIDEDKASNLRDRATSTIDTLAALIPPPSSADRDLLSTPPVQEALTMAAEAFSGLANYAEGLPEDDDQAKAAKELLQRSLGNIVFDLSLLHLGTTDTQVAWVEPHGHDKVALRSAQFDVSQRIFSRLIEPYRSVVFTSATLTVGGKFDQPAREYGFTLGPWQGKVVPSPFDYSKQGMLWLPEGMPLPGFQPEVARKYAEAVADVAAKIARAAGGRTLVLCTSRAGVQQVAERLRENLEPKYPVLAQEPGEPTKKIAQDFTANPRAVLVGTRAFWSGISIEGDTCAAVVLDKTPFPSPADPIIAARSEKADRTGGSGFRDVSLPAALLTVVQGVGRLIRTVHDRGVVVLCDPRTHAGRPRSKSYARDLMRSLPDFKVTSEESTAMDFLAEINRTADDTSAHLEVDARAA